MEPRTRKAEVLEKCEDPPAPGKVILHGDHSVVYGRLAIAASLGLRTTLSITETHSPCLNVSLKCRDIGLIINFGIQDVVNTLAEGGIPLLSEHPIYDFEHPEYIDQEKLLRRIERFLEDKQLNDPMKKVSMVTFLYLYAAIFLPAKVPLKSIELQAHTELQVGAGMGSSASFAVVIVCGLLEYIKQKCKTKRCSTVGYLSVLETKAGNELSHHERELISLWAYHAEKITHGNPSGIDNSLCTFGSVMEFRKGTHPKPLYLTMKLNALLIDTKVSRNTKALVERVALLKDRYPGIVEHTLDSMEIVATKAIDYLQKLGNAHHDIEQISSYYNSLQELADMNQNMLRILGVSHPAIDRICKILHDNNLCGKLTGAGGGGFVLAIIPPDVKKKTLDAITQTLAGENYGFRLLELGGEGVRVD